ncbi:ferritin [bacterium]|nr:ferritin [bacterium]
METKLLQAFNRQINHEFYGAYLYFAMSTYFSEISMQGFCDFMKHKASQKLDSAQKIYDYLILRDEKLIFSKIEEPSIDWINVSDVFSSALSHEEFMFAQIKELHQNAKEADDIAAMEYISEFINEQVKNVGYFRKLVFRIKNANVITPNIEYLDGVINTI